MSHYVRLKNLTAEFLFDIRLLELVYSHACQHTVVNCFHSEKIKVTSKYCLKVFSTAEFFTLSLKLLSEVFIVDNFVYLRE
jgi:hypothetical protein